MPGDEWQKFANLRAMYVYMFTNPGAKLLFMGDEIAQTNEWNFTTSLDWHLLEHPIHKNLQNFVRDLNLLYKSHPALYEQQFSPNGYEWVNADDRDNSIFIFLRKSKENKEVLMTVLNLTPNTFDYRIGVEKDSKWEVVLNSDDAKYSGSGIEANISEELDEAWDNRENSMILRLPPLSGLVLKQTKLVKPKTTIKDFIKKKK
ncbi:1,4-alpha-glucan branching enzyme GlgB [compost metagenome]